MNLIILNKVKICCFFAKMLKINEKIIKYEFIFDLILNIFNDK